jgi:NAD(P)-dependent dehydrogenase (short-subunit alcohol dehydrogenase family)
LPHLIERGGGSILYTSSGAAHSPERVRVPYSMSKAAIHALARIVATRHGPDNIRANVIAPGVIIHKQNEEIAPEWFIKWAYDRIPLKARLGRAEDISAMAALLMSDEGAFVTGQVISVDGGATMRL